MAAICAAAVLAGLPALSRLVRLLLARVTDVAKRRRQELWSAAQLCPFEGLIYARSSVTLAPAFLAGALACWSWTMRLYDASACSASSRSAVRISWLVDQIPALRGVFWERRR